MSIGNRLRQARLASGLTLDEVSERLNREITKAALSKYEHNRSIPRPTLLIKIAKVLDQKAAFFISEDVPKIEWIAYRKHTALLINRQMHIQSYAANIVESYLNFRSLFCTEEIVFPDRTQVSNVKDAETVAESLRQRWVLDKFPVMSVAQLIEDKGAVVIEWEQSNGFDGLSGFVNSSFPVIVTCFNMSTDRIRYNICHELGHLLMDCSSVEPKEEEKIAHRFAGAFLVPKESMFRELGTNRRHLNLDELALLKRKYGASMQALMHRAYDLGIITYTQYKNLNIEFRKRGWHKQEPVPYVGDEEPKRLRQMVLRAMAEGLISREKAMGICPEIKDVLGPGREGVETIGKARQLMKLPIAERRRVLEEIDSEAIKLYNEDPESVGSDILDEEKYAEEG
jgi:Zn-dependent peptidase ImmA (M78 family)/DNA-binding XRE family transcriptional regulator